MSDKQASQAPGPGVGLDDISRGVPIDVPAELSEVVDAAELAALQCDLDRIAQVRRDVEAEAAALRLG